MAVFGPTSLPIFVVAMSLKPDDTFLSRGVMRPHLNHISWRQKTPSVKNIPRTSAFSEGTAENDLLTSIHVEGLKATFHLMNGPRIFDPQL